MFLRICLTIFYSVLILGLSGITNLANAASSCHDLISQGASAYKYSDALVHFVFYNGKTYAISKSAASGKTSGADVYFAMNANITQEYRVSGTDTASLKMLLSLGKFGDAAPVVVTDETLMQFLLTQYGRYLGSASSSNSSYINAWKDYGAGKPFTLMNGSALGYTNWTGGTAPAVAAITEPQAVTMGSDGTWVNGSNGQRLSQIVEFNGQLDCAIDLTPTDPPVVDVPPGPTTNKVCAVDLNGNGEIESNEMAQCVQTPQGEFCPVGAVSCQNVGTDPVCPAGSTLNTERDMCQAVPVSKCGAGYTYDTTLDLCVAPVPCTDGGTFNAATNRCEKLVSNECPATYTYDSGRDVCWKPVGCPGGSFVAERDRCETPVGVGCSDPSYTYNAAQDRCEKAPVCSQGTYNGTYNRCLLNYTIGCPSGYSYNSSRNRCERTPVCSSGTYNSATDKCEWTTTGSYAATASYSCPSGGTLSGTSCITTSTYAATATTTGGVTYSVAVHKIGQPIGMSCSCSGYAGYYLIGGSSCSCGLIGYMASSSFTGSVALHKLGSLIGISCQTSYKLGLDPSGSGACSGGIAGYMASSSFSEAIPLHRVGERMGSSCMYATAVGPAPSGSGACSGGIAGYIAPAAGTYGGTTTYTCNLGDTLSGTTCTHTGSYSATATYSCPSGGTLSGSTCNTSTLNQAFPNCPSGTMDYGVDVCYANYTIQCPSGMTYDAGIGLCYQTPACSNGALDISRDVCYQARATSCASPWVFDSGINLCYSPPVCSSGSYNSTLDQCLATITRACGSYTWSAPDNKCIQGVTCPSDPTFSQNSTVAFSEALDACASQAEHNCPAETSYNGMPVKKCEAVPVCPTGTYDPATDKCREGNICPLGTQYTCMDYQGTSQCTPNQCVDPSNVPGAVETNFDETMLQDDARNPDGTCGGQILVFSGKSSRCRPPGLKVGMVNNCCESDSVMTEDTGNAIVSGVQAIKLAYQLGQVAYYSYMVATGAMAAPPAVSAAGTLAVVSATATTTSTTLTGAVASGVAAGSAASAGGATVAGSMVSSLTQYVGALLNPATIVIAIVIMVVMKILFGSGCDQGDIQTAMQAKSKQCHYLGEYCQTEWPMGCIQKAKGYCCFNSIMARVIHEQGRPQLSAFGANGGWGTPEKPECRGFTPEEFEALDFAKIDLSEYYTEIQDGLNTKIDNATDKINTSIQNRVNQMNP